MVTNGKDENQESIKEIFLESIKDLEKKQSQLLMLQVLRKKEEKLKEEIEQDTRFIANSLLDLEKEIQEVENLNKGKTYNTNDINSLKAAFSIISRQGAIETKYKELKLCSCELALKKASLEKFILLEIEQIKKALCL